MSAPTLYGHQTKLVSDIRTAFRSHRSVVLQSPTGSGKTVLTAHMIREAARRKRTAWFVVHRKELLKQTSDALWESEVPHGRIVSGKNLTKDPIQVASIQTLVRRLDVLDPPDLLIIDEAHHTAAASYVQVMDHCKGSYVVGLTATPCRTDGRGLDDLFDYLVPGPSVAWLMAEGYLSNYRVVAPPSKMDLSGVHRRGGDFARGELEVAVDKATLMGDAVEHYRKFVLDRAKGRIPSCLVYCVSRKHAHHVTDAYRAQGINAMYCAGDTPEVERDAIVSGFRLGNPPVIVSVDLFGEGLDVPGLFAIQILRPTESLSLHLQMCGRVLRVEKGKEYAMILDHVGNTWRHGLPDDVFEWTLEGRRKKKGAPEETGPAIIVCENCYIVYRSILPACPNCGVAPKRAEHQTGPLEVDGELVEIEAARHRAIRAREEGQAKGLEALVALARERGYKKGAAWAGIRHAVRTKGDRMQCIRDAQRIWRDGPTT